MRKSKVIIFAITMLLMTLCFFLSPRAQEVRASSGYMVTFNYKIEEIVDYIPNSETLYKSLQTYSIEVDDGAIAVEQSKPLSYISMSYSYKWTVDGQVVDIHNYPITKDTVFEALWIPNTFNVYFTFESLAVRDEITNLQTQLSFSIETPKTSYYIPNRPNYRFVGWFIAGSPIIQHYLAPKSTGDVILMAKFMPIEYVINYNTRGFNPNPYSYNVQDPDITLETPERDGYIFGGWYADKDFTQPITEIVCSAGGDINIYPKWEIKTYNVTYVLPDGTKQTVVTGYGSTADLPKLNSKGFFDIVRTDISRNNIVDDTTIRIEYVSIWYVYLIALAVILCAVSLIVLVKRKKEIRHARLRAIYQSNSSKFKRK